MTIIFTIMLPILLLIALGFMAVRTGLTAETHVQGLAGFVMNFALPAVLLSALSRQDISSTFNLPYVAAYSIGSLTAFAAAFGVLRYWMKRPLDRAAVGGIGASMSNSGFIGFPVASLTFGATALVALPMTMLVENILILPLALAMMEVASGKSQTITGIVRETASRLVRMPLILAIAAGAFLAATGLSLPHPILTTIDMLAAASAPCALFVVGGTIALLKRTDIAADIAPIVIAKLLIHPAATTAAMLLIPGIPTQLQAAGILLSSISMITIYPILARRSGMEGVAAAALICATVLALVTITIVLILLAPLAG